MDILVNMFPHYKEGEKKALIERLLLVVQVILKESIAIRDQLNKDEMQIEIIDQKLSKKDEEKLGK